MRYVELDGMKNHFCQMTASISSKQQVRMLKEDQIVKETDQVNVSENWVFEIIVNKSDSDWRFCGRV